MKRLKPTPTSERLGGTDHSAYGMMSQMRHLFAYECALERTPGGLALDLGCGGGYGSGIMGRKCHVVGVDADAAVAASAKSDYGGGCAFVCARTEALPFIDGAFDAVVSLQVIEHMSDEKAYLSEAKRVLKQEGVFVVSTPNRQTRLIDGERPWNRFHVREYNSLTLEHALKRFFRQVTILGIKGSRRVTELERRRIAEIRRVSSMDPLHLRRLMPEWLRYRLAEAIKKLFHGKNGRECAIFSREDFIVCEDTLGCLDLLGLCKNRDDL
jgi:SAM-dependent methyltransferase